MYIKGPSRAHQLLKGPSRVHQGSINDPSRVHQMSIDGSRVHQGSVKSPSRINQGSIECQSITQIKLEWYLTNDAMVSARYVHACPDHDPIPRSIRAILVWGVCVYTSTHFAPNACTDLCVFVRSATIHTSLNDNSPTADINESQSS